LLPLAVKVGVRDVGFGGVSIVDGRVGERELNGEVVGDGRGHLDVTGEKAVAVVLEEATLATAVDAVTRLIGVELREGAGGGVDLEFALGDTRHDGQAGGGRDGDEHEAISRDSGEGVEGLGVGS
jgi:hypothetical protein